MAEKPFSMIYRETKKQIVDIINTSKLPADVLLSIMNSLTIEIANQADMAYSNDLQHYQESLNKEAQEAEVCEK